MTGDVCAACRKPITDEPWRVGKPEKLYHDACLWPILAVERRASALDTSAAHTSRRERSA